MKLVVVLLIFATHISAFFGDLDKNPLVFPKFVIDDEDPELTNLLTSLDQSDRPYHIHSGYNPLELLLRGELDFLSTMGLRMTIFLKAFVKIYLEVNKEVDKNLEDRMKSSCLHFFQSLQKATNKMQIDLNSVIDKYDQKDFKIPEREPTTFAAIEPIRDIFNIFYEIYELVEEEIEAKVVEQEQKERLLWNLKVITSFSGLSAKVMLMKMFYEIGLRRNLKMRFITAGIYYLLIFEDGLTKKVINFRMEDKKEFFDKLIKNFDTSAEELIDRIMFHITEDEIPKDNNRKLTRDLEKMREDFGELVKPLIEGGGNIKTLKA